MPIEIDWGNLEKTILVCKLKYHWTQADVYAALKQCNQLTQSNPDGAELFIDVRLSRASPGNLISIVHLCLKKTRCKRIIVIRHTSFWDMIYANVQMRFIGNMPMVHFVETVDDAYEYIEQIWGSDSAEVGKI